MVVQASKLHIPHHHHHPPLSLLFEPHSLSLALMLSDSSFSLFSPLSLSSLSLPSSPPPTSIPPPSSAACFLPLQTPNPNPNPNSSSPNSRTLFVVSSPHAGGASIRLRFYLQSEKKNLGFCRVSRVICTQRGFGFDDELGFVIVDSVHGVSIKLLGTVNFFVMHSISAKKVWVFGVKVVSDDDNDDVIVRLVKCAVIDCSVQVFSIAVSVGVLVLGEQNGVRVFPMAALVKTRGEKVREKRILNGCLDGEKVGVKGLCLPNGIKRIDGCNGLLFGSMNYSSLGSAMKAKSVGIEGNVEINCNGYLVGKINKHGSLVKHGSIKLRQDSGEKGSCFLAFNKKEAKRPKHMMMMPAKAISIQVVSPRKFLILDSDGDIHLLGPPSSAHSTDTTFQMRQLTHIMKVQKMVVLPDISSIRTPIVWISDGLHSVHMMTISDVETSINDDDKNYIDEKLMQASVIQAIFASERIRDIIPLAANAILILGEGSLFAYAIS